MTTNHEFTPDTEQIRTIYAQDAHSEAHRKEYEAEFDRWYQAEIEAAAELHDQIVLLANALRAVLELHKPSELYPAVTPGVIYCHSCWDGVTDEAYEYPCPTVQAITDALGDSDGTR